MGGDGFALTVGDGRHLKGSASDGPGTGALLLHVGTPAGLLNAHGDWLARHVAGTHARLFVDEGHISVVARFESPTPWRALASDLEELGGQGPARQSALPVYAIASL